MTDDADRQNTPAEEQRRRRIDEIVEAAMARCAAGEPIDVAPMIAEHPELMPQLGDRLRALRLIQEAENALAEHTLPTDGEPQPPLPSLPPPGSFPGYQIIREIHRGGQGVVYQAVQQSTKRKVAIKVLKDGSFAGKADKARFEREVEVLGQLNHPNIVTIHDSGQAAGLSYFVMDYISGQPLDVWMAERERSIEETLRLFQKICEAVDVAHLRGVIHRDLKPGNIRIDEAGEPHILDFGLAKTTRGAAEASLVTLTGHFMGSVPWASPEQAEAMPAKIDIRTDVYSLGVILYQMLTGRFPYDVAGSMPDVLDRIIKAEPTRPSTLRREIRYEVETIVLKCLRKERERRYGGAGAIAEDIRRYLAGEPIQARRDSVSYVLWVRTRQVLRRHPLIAVLGGLVLIALLTQSLAVSVVYHWTPLNSYYEKALTAMPPARPAPDFEHVRLIALTDETDIAGLARGEHLPGISTEDGFSLRRLHGALMQRLAPSGLKVLVLDIVFENPSAFDYDLVGGINKVHEYGVDVIAGMGEWELGDTGLPALTPAILPYVKRGTTTGDFSSERAWSLDACVGRDGRDPAASLALLAFASYQKPGAVASLLLDGENQGVALHYWKPVPGVPEAKDWLKGDDFVQLTGLWECEEDNVELHLRRGDAIGHYYLTVPRDDVLRSCTREYQEVFRADTATLRNWFADCVVIVGDLRRSADRYPCQGGRRIPYPYAQAVAIDAMLRSAALPSPTTMHTWIIVGLAVLAGGAAGLLLCRSVARGALLLAALAALTVVASIEAYRELRYLVNPLVPLFALVVSGAFMAFVCRSRRTSGWAGKAGTGT